MKQNVLIVHNHYQLTGGEANVADNEARLLSEHGHFVARYSRDNTEIAHYSILQKICLPLTTLFSFRTYRDIRQFIAREHIDVVHVHNTVPLVSPSVYYAAWSMGVPVVQTVHNYRLLCPNGMCYRDGHVCQDCLNKGLFCAVEHGCYRDSRVQSVVLAFCIGLHRLLKTYRRIEAYIALTPFMQDKLAEKLPARSIFVKPNIVDVPQKAIPYEKHGQEYVFFGRLDVQKGVWVLLKAFAQLPECHLILIGGGPEEEGMRAFIEERGMKNITMTGPLPHDETLAYVAGAKAFVMPTQLYEGLPLTVLESFSLATPVIGSEIGNVGTLIAGHGGGFTFDQSNPTALAECIKALTRAQLRQASDEALLAAKTLCDKEKNYQTLIRIYDEASARRVKHR